MSIDFETLKKEDCRAVARRLGLELDRNNKTRCFLHDGDKNPSLQIYSDGWKCFGCGERGDVVDLVSRYLKVSISEAARWLQGEEGPPTQRGHPEREHLYPSGQLKKVIYRKPDGSKYACWLHLEHGAWKKGRGTSPPSLYIAGQISGAAFVCEGEKDADTLHHLGFDAVSGENGAGRGKWLLEYTQQLRGVDCVIFQDNDDVGRAYAQETAAALHGTAASVKVLDLSKVWPEIPEKGDVSDFFEHFGGKEACRMMLKLMGETPVWEPAPDPFLSYFKSLDSFTEEAATWLVDGWIPEGQITLLAADGGIGKTTLWCNVIAAISSGGRCILDPPGYQRSPQKVAFLTTEDSVRKKLKKKLRLAGATMSNIITPDFLADKEGVLRGLKFGSQEMERFVRHFRPALCVFDPVQGFVPPDINMGSRNVMRDCMAPLISLGEDTGTTFLVVCHTNKRPKASGRDRIADSADLWDVSRSDLMAGYTEDQGVRYLSNEKNNYAQLQETLLFTIDENGQAQAEGTSSKRDREYTQEAAVSISAPKRDDCKEWILNELDEAGGAMPSKELEGKAHLAGYSFRTLRRAKDELKQTGAVKYFQTGGGKDKAWHVQKMGLTEPSDDIPEQWSNDQQETA